jgi:DNA-binding transcriptional MerR regulator
MKMKEVCSRTHLTERTIRYYSEEGLINPPSYEMNGRTYFDFTEEDIRCLNYIAVLRKTGFSIEQINEMQKKPDRIKDTVLTLLEELEKQRAEADRSISALGVVKSDKLTDIGALAAILQGSAEEKELPAADLEPDFGRFDIQSREEKHRAYEEFLSHRGRRVKRNRTIGLSACGIALIAVSVFITLCVTRQVNKKSAETEKQRAEADCLIGAYEEGNVKLAFEDEAYTLSAQGLHGGTLQMTRIYTNGEKEISLSWSYLTEAENLLVEQALLDMGSFKIEKGLGKAVVMTILPAEDKSEYFAVYADSEDMTAEELLDAVDGRVSVTCDWWIQYYPRAGGNIWTALTGINDMTNPTLITESHMDYSLNQTPGLTEEFSEGLLKILKGSRWRVVKEHGSEIEGSAFWFTEHCFITLDFYDDGTVAYHINKYRSKLSPEDYEFFIWLRAENGDIAAAEIRTLLSDTIAKCETQR